MSAPIPTWQWDLLRVAREVVDDYAEKVCDNLGACDCSMARLARLVSEDHGVEPCMCGTGFTCLAAVHCAEEGDS